MKFLCKIIPLFIFAFVVFDFFSCKKDKLITSANAKLEFSQDSVLFDTVFTTLGSSTKNIRIRNLHSQKIKISSIALEGGSSSPFFINVDGSKGISFSDIEIAAHDSMYIFIQVNINPNNSNSPLIVTDAIDFTVNGNLQKVVLEAWGQDAYYHFPTDAIYFQDGSYFTYSIVDSLPNSFTRSGGNIIWKNDKPHVIYGYCVVDSAEKLIIPAGTQVYLNYKAGLWVYAYGELQVQGQKDKEVVFQEARRDQDWLGKPGQWDRIWINEGSVNNKIDYAIIKNGYIGIQAELIGSDFINLPRHLTVTNTKIQNMSLWGIYGLAFNITGGNNLIDNCQEYSVNLMLGGSYKFYDCTFSNFWNQSTPRTKPTLNINNYDDDVTLPDTVYFGNCIVDGKLADEVNIDVKAGSAGTLAIGPQISFSSCWLKTTKDVSDANRYQFVSTGTTSLNYKDPDNYNFETTNESRIKNFTNQQAIQDATRFPKDLNNMPRNLSNITIGAYEDN